MQIVVGEESAKLGIVCQRLMLGVEIRWLTVGEGHNRWYWVAWQVVGLDYEVFYFLAFVHLFSYLYK